jgi:protocatechuate 4,5-dioxygenase beta chain
VAQLVEIIGTTHNPVLPGLFERTPDAEPALRKALENFGLMRRKLAQARPDVIVIAAGDHLNQWFMNNMAPFVIGKARSAHGPFPHERRINGLPEYHAAVDVDVASALLREGYAHGIDFAYSDEFRIDHAFTMPLTYLRPEMDIPIVPLWTNVMAPPIPPAQRFYDVGLAIRAIVDALPASRRVAVMASGHMANSVGGPGMLMKQQDPVMPFDVVMRDLVQAGDAPGVIREASWERLMRAGGGTPGFLDFVLLLGVAAGARPSYVDLNSTRVTEASFFVTWDLADGRSA